MEAVRITREDLHPSYQDVDIRDIDFPMLGNHVHELCLTAMQTLFVDINGLTKIINDQREFNHINFKRYASALTGIVTILSNKRGGITEIKRILETRKDYWGAPSSINQQQKPSRLIVTFEKPFNAMLFGFWLLRRSGDGTYVVSMEGDLENLVM